ncbi:MAG TPA: hypothetical protein VJW20_10365 [Candidatus Angelobacter sp.]|nr:hypothetical protein [Candidatus Angelobacter sp.]
MRAYFSNKNFLIGILMLSLLYLGNARADIGGKVSKVLVINSAGQPIRSIFDGLQPSENVRNVLLLHKDPQGMHAKLDPFRFRLNRLIAGPPVYFACQTKGICGQSGTTQGPPGPCNDNNCNVSNITDSDDPNDGTIEEYCGVDCCVNWLKCTFEEPPPDLCDPQCKSPIIIDVEGEGFHLTAAVNGVRFDIDGSGHPVQIAWTNSSFHNALLALPGKDGLVHNGKELFGNFTPQPDSPTPNGFAALAEYDKPENGGNGDGVIDQKDRVYASLRLWIDANHDGICQSSELHSLTEFGIYSLSLAYTESRRVDEFGNLFRYRAQVNPGDQKDRRDNNQAGDPGRWTYDVFLRAQ